jgi:hypothetical protein
MFAGRDFLIRLSATYPLTIGCPARRVAEQPCQSFLKFDQLDLVTLISFSHKEN